MPKSGSGTGGRVKAPVPSPPPSPKPGSGLPVAPAPPYENVDVVIGLFSVGAGSNPAAYAPNPQIPVAYPDPTKGNVAAVVGYVGPVLESLSQGSAPPMTCAVLGQGNLSCPGVVGLNGDLEDENGQPVTDPDASGDGVFGFGSINGVHGLGTSGTGVGGTSTSGSGVFGKTTTGVGVHGQSLGSGLAGQFDGNVKISGNLSTTNIDATGNITAKDVLLSGADCAEEFDLLDASVEPGTVVVIDEDGKLRESQSAYDKRVAGVVSGAGEYRPGILLDRRVSSVGRAAVALVGKVYCKVDADPAPIIVGDLLTTSERPGFGMKATDAAQAFGAVIGKALKPLRAGQAVIPILVGLQ